MSDKVLRRHAAPLLDAKSGVPLIKSIPSLGRRLVMEHCVSTFDADMPEHLLKKALYEDFRTFVQWLNKESGANFRKLVRIEGPTPHIGYAPNNIQVGDRGGTREVARNLLADSSDTGKVDYRTYCLFDAPEFINEIPTDLALDMFGKGRKGLKPLREKEWRNEGDKWFPRN